MKSKKWWLGILGVIILSLIAGGIAFRGIFTETPTLQPVISRSTKDMPEEWPEDTTETLEKERGERINPKEPDTMREERVEERQTSLPEGNVEIGRLVFEGQGKRLGEESYLLRRLESGKVQLTSTGTFAFQVLFVKLKFEYTQEINLDSDLRPISFALDMNGPLGFGNQKTEIKIEGDTAFISAGDEKREENIESDNTIILGMFSSYALIPKLFEVRANGDKANFKVLTSGGFGGREGRRREEASTGASSPPSPISFVEVERIGTVMIKDVSKEIEIERYLIKTGNGESTLLAKDGELIGFIGQGPNGSFVVYRADLFPKGFEMVADGKK
jgi:hypothetical protein